MDKDCMDTEGKPMYNELTKYNNEMEIVVNFHLQRNGNCYLDTITEMKYNNSN